MESLAFARVLGLSSIFLSKIELKRSQEVDNAIGRYPSKSNLTDGPAQTTAVLH